MADKDSKKNDTTKVGQVEDAEQIQTDAVAEDDRDRANEQQKQLEKALNSPPGGPEVKVNTPQEIAKNQESADADFRKTEVAQTNAGLDSPHRPGGEDGNGRIYKDERIDPSDTNAPDAGLLPDGTRVAV